MQLRQGREYLLVIDGYKHPSDVGKLFVQPHDEAAIEFAHETACFISRSEDKFRLPEHKYPIHSYKLYHQNSGRLIIDYKPPSPEEAADMDN